MHIVIVIHYGLRIINHLHFKNFFFKPIRYTFCCIKQKGCSILSILLSKSKSIYWCKWKKDTATNSNNLPMEKWIHQNIILWEISIHENCFVYAWMMRMLCNLLPWKITTSENVGRKKNLRLLWWENMSIYVQCHQGMNEAITLLLSNI